VLAQSLCVGFVLPAAQLAHVHAVLSGDSRGRHSCSIRRKRGPFAERRCPTQSTWRLSRCPGGGP
jgi:hypothetical protein